MSKIKHNAIIITTNNVVLFNELLIFVKFIDLSYIKNTKIYPNGYQTMCIYPVGLDVGLEEYKIEMIKRDKLKDWLKSNRYEDDSSSLEWAEVEYGNDIQSADVIDHEWN